MSDSTWWIPADDHDESSHGNRWDDGSDPDKISILDIVDAYLNDHIGTVASTKAYTAWRDSLPADERHDWPSPRTMVSRLGKLAKPCRQHKRTPRQKGEQCAKCETAWQAAERLVPRVWGDGE